MTIFKGFRRAFMSNKIRGFLMTILKNNKNLSISILFALFALSLCFTSYSFKNNSDTFILHPTINSNDSFEIISVVEPIPAYDPTPPYYFSKLS